MEEIERKRGTEASSKRERERERPCACDVVNMV